MTSHPDSVLVLPSPGPGADHPPDLPAGLPGSGSSEGKAGGLTAAVTVPVALIHHADVAHPTGEASTEMWP